MSDTRILPLDTLEYWERLDQLSDQELGQYFRLLMHSWSSKLWGAGSAKSSLAGIEGIDHLFSVWGIHGSADVSVIPTSPGFNHAFEVVTGAPPKHCEGADLGIDWEAQKEVGHTDSAPLGYWNNEIDASAETQVTIAEPTITADTVVNPNFPKNVAGALLTACGATIDPMQPFYWHRREHNIEAVQILSDLHLSTGQAVAFLNECPDQPGIRDVSELRDLLEECVGDG